MSNIKEFGTTMEGSYRLIASLLSSILRANSLSNNRTSTLDLSMSQIELEFSARMSLRKANGSFIFLQYLG